MGSCFSDVRGGQERVGAGSRSARGNAAPEGNDAVDHLLISRGLRGLYSQIELSVSATKLRDRDVLSSSDPMAVLFAKKPDGRLQEIGRTEVIMNSLNPAWITKFIVNYQFEIVQPLVFQIFDVDTKYHNTTVKALQLNDQDFLGEATCVLSEIVCKPTRSLVLDLHDKKAHHATRLGSITVHAEETVSSRTVIDMTLRCSNLQNKEMFSISDPFLTISRAVENGGLIPICKTEVIKNNLNPVWKPLVLTMQQFGSKDNPLMVHCYDFNSNGKHQLLGQLQTSISAFEKLNKEKAGVNFYYGKKMLKGQLFIDCFIEKPQYTFVDYISSGFELNFMVAIDFTASNGDPRLPESLHCIDPTGCLNPYQQAIVSVGEVLEFYDSDKRFPAWGFGGRLLDGSVSHCFNINGNPSDSQVLGVEGIMSAYTMAQHNITFAGPTIFGPVIHKAAETAGHSAANNQNKYSILLIITDGVITDLQESKDAIVRASDLPLSILIVGVGGADFKDMEILDADNGRRLESSTGRVATRDIVQFVPMNDIQRGGISIAQALLEELPGQFLAYYRSRDIKPQYAQC